ncbi:MAG: hypothetical protein AB7F43_00865 [Bacteriovoracia bacterium]
MDNLLRILKKIIGQNSVAKHGSPTSQKKPLQRPHSCDKSLCHTQVQPSNRALRNRGARKARRHSGNLVLFMATLYIPIFSILATTLWIKGVSLLNVKKQKSVDRCVFHHLQRRCAILTDLRILNKELKMTAVTISSIRTGEAIAAIVSGGAAIGAILSTERFIKFLQWTARATAKLQNVMKLPLEIPPMGCGLPIRAKRLRFNREYEALHVVAGIPNPLELSGGFSATEIWFLREWTGRAGRIESFGSCFNDDSKIGVQFKHAKRSERNVLN